MKIGVKFVFFGLMMTTVNASRIVHANSSKISEVIPLTSVNRKDRAAAEKRGFWPLSDWMATPWTGSDKPFSSVKKEIDNVSQQNKFSPSMLDKYQSEAKKRPKDPLAQFRWGYAYFRSTNDGVFVGTIQKNADTVRDIAWSLYEAPSPHSYEYTRLQFLIGTRWTVAGLSPVGKRLIKHTPQDYEVQCYYYPSLLSSPVPGSRDKALQGALDLTRLYPGRGGPFSTLADVYAANWLQGDIHSGPLALDAYQKYLSMPPKGLTPIAKEGLQHWMDFIRKHPEGPKGPKIG